mmetsp:Transcript_5607/g.21190  ORF Transcript_5607/g.21190 Transcript_5607/m.21190 type:complete len:240 (+) Transcript_5607:522-1241(+)
MWSRRCSGPAAQRRPAGATPRCSRSVSWRCAGPCRSPRASSGPSTPPCRRPRKRRRPLQRRAWRPRRQRLLERCSCRTMRRSTRMTTASSMVLCLKTSGASAAWASRRTVQWLRCCSVRRRGTRAASSGRWSCSSRPPPRTSPRPPRALLPRRRGGRGEGGSRRGRHRSDANRRRPRWSLRLSSEKGAATIAGPFPRMRPSAAIVAGASGLEGRLERPMRNETILVDRMMARGAARRNR